MALNWLYRDTLQYICTSFKAVIYTFFLNKKLLSWQICYEIEKNVQINYFASTSSGLTAIKFELGPLVVMPAHGELEIGNKMS